MAVGGFVLGLGYALLIGSANIANLIYGGNTVGGGAPLSTGDAFTISFWLLCAGLVLLPVGAAVLIYGIAAQRSPPAAVPAELPSAAGQ